MVNIKRYSSDKQKLFGILIFFTDFKELLRPKSLGITGQRQGLLLQCQDFRFAYLGEHEGKKGSWKGEQVIKE